MLYGIRIEGNKSKNGSRRRREKVNRLILLGLSLFFIFGSTQKSGSMMMICLEFDNIGCPIVMAVEL